MCSRVIHQLQASGNRHNITPFCHMCRRNINNITVLIPVIYLKSIVMKHSASLYKGRIGKRNSLALLKERAEDVQKTLNTCTDHNILPTT